MTVEKEKNGGCLNVKIDGSVDVNTSQGFRSEIIDELEDVSLVRFDMEKMDYISSAGLRVILEIFQILEDKGGRVSLVNVREEVREIFEVTGFTAVMEIND